MNVATYGAAGVDAKMSPAKSPSPWRLAAFLFHVAFSIASGHAECVALPVRIENSSCEWPLGNRVRSSTVEYSPFENDVYLKGTLLIIVRGRGDGRPKSGERVLVRACGFV
jgi:hypothetical protein